MNEQAAIIVGQRRGRIWYGRLRQRCIGAPSEVAFDWTWALAREEQRGDVVGFFHTHPAGFPRPSTRDVRTMRAWVSSFGKPLLCVIGSGDELAAYLFVTDADDGRILESVERFPRGVIITVANSEGGHTYG